MKVTVLARVYIKQSLSLKQFQPLIKQSVYMFRALTRLTPRLMKSAIVVSGAFFLHQHLNLHPARIQSFEYLSKEPSQYSQVLDNIVTIQSNDQIVGYAYCFDHHLLVTASPEMMQKRKGLKELSYKYKGKTIVGKFQIVGQFQNLCFIRFQNEEIQPIKKKSKTNSIMKVNVIEPRRFLSIRDGHLVAKELGYGIVSGKGETGSLVISQGAPVGIISQIGRDSDSEFMRIILWQHLSNLAKRLSSKPLYLGISAISVENGEGVSITRVASNSPLRAVLAMGDVVTKVNSFSIANPEDLYRVVMLSNENEEVSITILRNQAENTVQCYI